ncbi:MAG TPA: 50S ribosomal protein L11 methyltransferase [Solirubrobacteraceae bacterium]|nr:50S ribosomal protein L11 methyltransferase [Solirubrobacteraceae bacterium]
MIRLALRIHREHADVVLADLLELVSSGVEESDLPGGVVEYAIYGMPGELPVLPDLRAAVGDALVEISTSEIPDDWSERWRDFHQPITICSPAPERMSALRVRTPWESPSERPGVREIVIDPGQAFGTGAHATTRLCLELLLALAGALGERSGLIDLGCGSGVLAIAAAALGYAPVLALDHDQLSVTAAAHNATANGVAIDARRFDLRHDPWPIADPKALPVVLANLLRPLLLELAETLEHPPEHLIASGLLVGEAEEVSSAFARRLGMSERERRESGEWAALWLQADR